VEEAKKSFNNGEFQEAIGVLERLIVTKTLPKESYVEASEYLAVAYVSTNQDQKAKEIFGEILEKKPDYKPSEHWWPHQRLMSSYYKTVQEIEPNASSPSPGIQTIAIMDFENNSVDDAEKYQNLGGALAKILIGDFAVISKLKVVEREQIQFILDELELVDKKVGGKSVVDPSYAPRIGKLLGAHSFVFGSFIKLGKIFRMDIRLVKTETGEIFKTASVEGKPDEIFELAKKLTLKITKNLDVDIKKTEKKKLDQIGKEEVPIEAVALFGDAMFNANQENFQKAFVKLEAALAMAPNFGKARDMLDVIRPLTL